MTLPPSPSFNLTPLESDLRYTTSLLVLASVDIPCPEHIMAYLEQDRSQIQDFVTQTQDSFDDDAYWDGVMENTIPFNNDLDNTARQGAPTLLNGSVASFDSVCPASAPGCDTPAVDRSVLQPGVSQDVQAPTPSLLPANPDSPAAVTGDNLTICYAMIPGQTASISSGDGSDSTGQGSGSEASTSCEQSVVRRSPRCTGGQNLDGLQPPVVPSHGSIPELAQSQSLSSPKSVDCPARLLDVGASASSNDPVGSVLGESLPNQAEACLDRDIEDRHGKGTLADALGPAQTVSPPQSSHGSSTAGSRGMILP